MTSLPITELGAVPPLLLLYRALCLDAPFSYWLDSSREESPMSRFSYLGIADEGELIRVDDARTQPDLWQQLEDAVQKAEQIDRAQAEAAGYPLGDILDGGYVGFMGYEASPEIGFKSHRTGKTPDAWWVQARKFLAYDHASGRAWAVGDKSWQEQVKSALHLLADQGVEESSVNLPRLDFPLPNREHYLAQIERSQHEIYEGNSYEVCLTAETSTYLPEVNHAAMFELYLAQRKHNSAPYAAFINGGDFYILSSSPERFLSISEEGWAESKPIKGTIARGTTPTEDAAAAAWLAGDAKTRAENLMIVDLLRNDLSRVCDPATVRVPVLMGVESYSTVHQLVSTIVGKLRAGVHPVQAAASCFPGGSMTGAPKPSTMQIIDGLEQRSRGVYSGALGFFGAGGATQLSIVIRTLVAHADGEVTLAAGGAIVADSDPDAEYEEMVTKLQAAVPASS